MNIKVADKAVQYTLCNATGTSNTVYIAALPPNRYPIAYYARVKTAFAGTTGMFVEVGVVGDTTRFMPKQPINRAGDLLPGNKYGNTGFCPSQFTDQQPKAGAQQDVIATFRGAALASLSAGEIEFVFVYAI